MPKSTNEEVKNKLANRYYSEILFKIAGKQLTASELALQFNKSRATLVRQCHELVTEKILNLSTDPKDKRRQIFSLNTEEITRRFLVLVFAGVKPREFSVPLGNKKKEAAFFIEALQKSEELKIPTVVELFEIISEPLRNPEEEKLIRKRKQLKQKFYELFAKV